MNEMIREEVKERYWINEGIKYSRGKVRYSRRDKIGEGFGKRKVGMKVKVKEYLYKVSYKYGFKENISNGVNILEGIIVRIVRRINNGYYDYWYKVKLENGKYKWVSYVIIE